VLPYQLLLVANVLQLRLNIFFLLGRRASWVQFRTFIEVVQPLDASGSSGRQLIFVEHLLVDITYVHANLTRHEGTDSVDLSDFIVQAVCFRCFANIVQSLNDRQILNGEEHDLEVGVFGLVLDLGALLQDLVNWIPLIVFLGNPDA